MRNFTLLALVSALAGCNGSADVSHAPVSTTAQLPAISGSVVFMGDSITARWDHLCDDISYCDNVGIGGQTSVQMLERFDKDVLAQRPSVVVILAGTNDLYLEDAPDTHAIQDMADKAARSGARVVLGLVTPNGNWHLEHYDGATGNEAVNRWNTSIKALAAMYGYGTVDYHTATLSADGTQDMTLFIADHIHPNDAGYALMWNVLKPELIRMQVTFPQT